MKVEQVRRLFVVIPSLWLATVVAADVWHGFRPPGIDDSLDDALHVFIDLSPVTYLLALVVLAVWVSGFERPRRGPWATTGALALCAYIVAEIAYLVLYGTHPVGSAVYSGMWPRFVSGLPAAIGTALVASSVLEDRRLRLSADVVALLWIAGPITVDTLFVFERSARGTGPQWQLPIVSGLLHFFTGVFALGLVWTPFLFLAAVAAFLYGCLLPGPWDVRVRRASVGFSAASLVFCWTRWALFIWD